MKHLAPTQRFGFWRYVMARWKKHIKSYGTPCMATVGPFRIWENPWTLLIKMSLTNLIHFGGSKGLLWLVATSWIREGLGLRCALFLDFPSGCLGSPEVVVFGSFAIEFSICAKSNKMKIQNWMKCGKRYMRSKLGFFFNETDHIGHPNRVNCWVYNGDYIVD